MNRVIEQKYDLGTIISTNTSEYIIEDYYKKQYEENGKIRTRNVYSCRCLKDNYMFDRSNKEIDNKIGCPVCVNKVIIYGINSLADIRPDLIDYFVDKDLPKTIAPRSNIYTDIKCPYCGYIKNMCVSNLFKTGFSCPICSDGISYPNKYMREFLSQLNLDYVPEKVFEWGKQFLYDEYIENYSMIIENDGEQHYRNNAFGMNINQKEIDTTKEKLALSNGIKYYIHIDCSKSNGIYIKNSIMNSQLPIIFSFKENDIDWTKCELNASKSFVRKVWEMWNNGMTGHEIIINTKLSDTTIRDYINRGYDIGICDKKFYYIKPDELRVKRNSNNNNHMFTIHPLYCIEEDAYYISSPEYVKVHSNENLCHKSINRAAKNNIAYKGKHYSYITKQEYNSKKILSLSNENIKVYGELIDNKYL